MATTINADLYEALIAAKVPKKKARAAAETGKEQEQLQTKLQEAAKEQEQSQAKMEETAKESARTSGKVELLIRIFLGTGLLTAGVIGWLTILTFGLGEDVARIDAKVTEVVTQVKNLEKRVTNLETRMTSLEERMTSLEDRVTNIEIKLDAMGQDLAEIKAILLEGR